MGRILCKPTLITSAPPRSEYQTLLELRGGWHSLSVSRFPPLFKLNDVTGFEDDQRLRVYNDTLYAVTQAVDD